MKISFFISAIVFYVIKVAFSNSVQVGTVLFTTTDLIKKCWTESDKSLLQARYMMQDVLPDPDCIDFSKPEAAAVLLDYFHACYQIISTSSYGKLQNLMYLALSDAIGGYLRGYILPCARRAYYAGQMQYTDAKKLFQLYEDIRVFLKTNGIGWAEPQKICYRKLRAKPLTISGGSLEACNVLYTIDRSKLHWNNPCDRCSFAREDSQGIHVCKSSKESFREASEGSFTPIRHSNSTSQSFPGNSTPHNATDSIQQISQNSSQRLMRGAVSDRKSRCMCRKKPLPTDDKRVIVPLPILDDCCAPNSIAVPFRRQPFRNLRMRNSAFVLEYYYIAVIKCFIAKGNSRTDIKNFNSQFHAWLVSQVFPHLSDEKWYPAFGGVLRVMETIRKFGAETSAKDPMLNDIEFMFPQGVPFDITDNPKLAGKEKVREVVQSCEKFPKRHYITTAMVLSLIWIFVFCTCAFYCQATKGRKLLYDNRSVASSTSQQKKPPGTKESNFVNFQFLVRFFQNRDNVSQDEQASHSAVENDGKKNFWESLKEEGKRRLGQEKEGQKARGRLVMTGQGDVPMLVIENPETLQQSFLQYPLNCVTRRAEGTKPRREDGEGEGKVQGEVETLWKKSSTRLKRNAPRVDEKKPKKRFRRAVRGRATSDDLFSKTSSNSCSLEDETKGSSTEKRTSSCCCSDSCHHSNTSVTKYSPRIQVEARTSSAAAKFFKKPVTRHKSYRKNSSQGSTPETESERDDSYTSESDY